MHRALLVPDILLEIFILFQWPSGSVFAALAKTRKTFYEPATNELWADILDLELLLGCSVTRLQPMIYGRFTYHCGWSSQGVKPLSELEACQFSRHATRVRSMRIEPDTHFHLSVFPNETCLFPRLMSLSFVLPCPTRYSHLFMSLTLRSCYQQSIQQILQISN
ncbi:hypothetical protein EDB19DRAFT_1750685 [Suillus lakei]|nr:hypothetical protein EDB19DRAFT_1750685 [Suillus lakei]